MARQIFDRQKSLAEIITQAGVKINRFSTKKTLALYRSSELNFKNHFGKRWSLHEKIL